MKSSIKFKILWIGICIILMFSLGIYLISAKLMRNSEKINQSKEVSVETVVETSALIIASECEMPKIEQLEQIHTENVEQSTAETKETIKDTGFVVCIDPGHYKGASKLQGENIYDYEEGVFTLKIALALRDELRQYGIRSYLTRENDSINISGYVNEKLDRGKISLRGEQAKEADLFVSIHTNANKDNANGYPTCSQPIDINKTIILLNQIAIGSDQIIQMADEIGQAVTTANYKQKICNTDQFQCVDKDHLMEWSDQYNDSLQVQGTVCYRWGEHGDYYGVLRGASTVGVPGMIIEHGFHTVEEVRRQAMQEDLAQKWAEADAYGIAKGFGVVR